MHMIEQLQLALLQIKHLPMLRMQSRPLMALFKLSTLQFQMLILTRLQHNQRKTRRTPMFSRLKLWLPMQEPIRIMLTIKLLKNSPDRLKLMQQMLRLTLRQPWMQVLKLVLQSRQLMAWNQVQQRRRTRPVVIFNLAKPKLQMLRIVLKM